MSYRAESMKMIYISGPITLGNTATPDQIALYKGRFRKKAQEIYAEGNLPLSPLENQADSWSEYMRKGIALMMGADLIYMLIDWRLSDGAVIEHNLALAVGIPIQYQENGI